ncbi:tRNA guanosine(15) transglycosylase TgtA [Candidatus Bathyarchaeota archaeon]|nr:tRNA guanosine(15) transglycosylase TgtA [Candidatus Bathyarchaeota archaeon]
MSFHVQSKDLLGRVGTLKTKSGAFTTPHMFPVLDPYHQILDPVFYEKAGISAVMTNAYLMRRGQRGSQPIDVHTTLGFSHSIATDSGAYQILEYGKVEVKPWEIIDYQERINTDIGVILDFPTGFRSDPKRARWTVDETLRRADEALDSVTRRDILWTGPVQGGVHVREVERSAAEMSRRNFAVYALGSPTELMESQRYDILVEMIVAAKKGLPPSKPFHLFGAGHPVLFPFLVALGCDLFDSAAYALYARAGRYLTSEGTQLLGDMHEFVCLCPVCIDTTPIEMLGAHPKAREERLAQHNLWACFSELRRIREAIRRGRLWELLEARARVHPSLMDCFDQIRKHSELVEPSSPIVKPHGIFHLSASSEERPESMVYRGRVSRSVQEKRKIVLALPGRWRRPFHEDPRYQVISNTFDDHPNISICYYSPSWGPVPIELDETFPIAQTEGRDLGDPTLYKSKAEGVARFVRNLRPRSVILVSEGDYGRHVSTELVKTLGKRRVAVLDGEKMKPQSLIRSVNRRVRRTS